MSEEIQQAVFWDHEDEEAVLFDHDLLAKRYTAAQVEKIEWRRDAILMLLGAGWPVTRIEQKLHVNFRTVQSLAKTYAEKVAGFNLEFAENLLRMGAGWFGLAAMKAADASFKDLALAAGIAMTHARDLKAMGLMPEKDVRTIDEDRIEAARIIREAMAADLAEQLGTPQPVAACGEAMVPANPQTTQEPQNPSK